MIVYQEKWTRRWWPTQAEAKDAAREARVGGGDRAGFAKVDVPTTEGREALCDWLNQLEAQAANAADTDIERIPTGSTFDTPPPMVLQSGAPLITPDTQRQWDAESIVGFILDRATVAQVESIFAAIGTRIAEARRAD